MTGTRRKKENPVNQKLSRESAEGRMKERWYTAAEVRRELYSELAEMRVDRDDHVQAWERGDGHHPEQCGLCEAYREQMAGVRRAIRRFGGRP
jgi:hypothetical protein